VLIEPGRRRRLPSDQPRLPGLLPRGRAAAVSVAAEKALGESPQRRPTFTTTPKQVERYVEVFRRSAIMVPDAPQPRLAVRRGPKDDYLVALVHAAGAMRGSLAMVISQRSPTWPRR
jgi:hypothetical protein